MTDVVEDFGIWADKERAAPMIDYDKRYTDFKHAIKMLPPVEERKNEVPMSQDQASNQSES